MERPAKRTHSLVGFVVGCFILSAFWSSLALVRPIFFPPLHRVLSDFLSMLFFDAELHMSVLYSVSNVFIGTGIALAGSILVSVGMALSRAVNISLSMPVDVLRSISALALYPIFIVMFGLGRDAHVAVIIWNVWANLLLVSLNGLLSTEKEVVEAAMLDGADRYRLLWHFRLPLALPAILLAVRVSFGMGWLSIIVSEMLGGTTGLGYLVLSYSQAFEFSKMYAVILVISMSGFLMSLFWMQISKIILTIKGIE